MTRFLTESLDLRSAKFTYNWEIAEILTASWQVAEHLYWLITEIPASQSISDGMWISADLGNMKWNFSDRIIGVTLKWAYKGKRLLFQGITRHEGKHIKLPA